MKTAEQPTSIKFRTIQTVAELERLVGEPFIQDRLLIDGAQNLNDEVMRRAIASNPARTSLFKTAIKSVVQMQRDIKPLVDNQDKLVQVGRTLGILNNLSSYVESEQLTKDLRDHQPGVMQDIASALHDHDFSKGGFSGYIEKPMSTGKTALYVFLANAIAGKRPEKKLKTLVLTPSNIIREQAAGKDGKGFSLLGDNTDLKVSSKDEHDRYTLDGDVDVVNYQALTTSKEVFERIKAKGYDVVVCDEAHRAIGKKTLEAIREISDDKIRIGFTATAEYAANHHVSKLFEVPIHEMSFREAGEMGITQPVNIIIKETTVGVELSKRDLMYTEEDYIALAHIKARNMIIAQDAVKLVSEGRQGIMSCLPGNDRFHAKYMAKLCSDQIITTPNGENRFMRARYIDGTMSPEERNAILDDYDKGNIDLITYVGLLDEGWDQPKATFLLNARPTDSPRLAKQRIGRVMRLNGTGLPNIVIDYIDNVKKLQYTGIEAFDLAPSYVERVHKVGDYSYQAGNPENTPAPWVSVEFANADSKDIYNQVIHALIKPVPEGYVTVKDASTILGSSVTNIYKAIERLGLELERFRGRTGHIGFHLSPEDFGEISSVVDPSFGLDEDDMTLQALAVKTAFGEETLRVLLKDNGVSPVIQRGARRYFSSQTVESVVKDYKKRNNPEEAQEEEPSYEKGTFLENILVQYPALSVKLLLETVKELGIELKVEVTNNKQRLRISDQDEINLLTKLQDILLPIPADYMEFKDLAEQSLFTAVQLRTIFDHPAIRNAIDFDIATLPKTIHTSGEFIRISDSELKKFQEKLREYYVPANFVAYHNLASRYPFTGSALTRYVRSNDIPYINRRNITTGSWNVYINESMLRQRISKDIGHREDWDPEAKTVSLSRISEHFGVDVRFLVQVLNLSDNDIPSSFVFYWKKSPYSNPSTAVRELSLESSKMWADRLDAMEHVPTSDMRTLVNRAQRLARRPKKKNEIVNLQK